jgi:SM-20-related protein
MITTPSLPAVAADEHALNDHLFANLASDLLTKGYSIKPAGLPDSLSEALRKHQLDMDQSLFDKAGIGRGDDFMQNAFVRTDEICWITGAAEAGRQWLDWAEALRCHLNQKLLLGLFSFESHFAHYRPGDYYKRHQDAFVGEANRVLSLVVYLNPGWGHEDGGELVLYQNEADQTGVRVTPLMGTVVAFLSEEFPHEVLPAVKDRYSVAGWFRVNTSHAGKIDPPR